MNITSVIVVPKRLDFSLLSGALLLRTTENVLEVRCAYNTRSDMIE
jgi:hypothetical protein